MKNGKPISLKERLERLEADVKEIKAMLQAQHPKPQGWQAIVGTFPDDPVHNEIIRLGLEVREKDRERARRRFAKEDARAKAKAKAKAKAPVS